MMMFKGLKLFLAAAIFATSVASAQVATPPGPNQFITPPLPTPIPAVTVETDPTTDDLSIPFQIIGSVGGEIQADPIITIEPGDLLTFTLGGDITATEEMSNVTWAVNRSTRNFSIHPADGKHATFSHKLLNGETHAVFLFTACVNNPDPLGAPFVAQRWVVVGLGPIPPPTVPTVPTVPADPVVSPPDTTLKTTQVVYVYEKDDGPVPSEVAAALGELNLIDGMRANLIEQDVKNGKVSAPDQFKIPFDEAKKLGLPSLIVMADSTIKNRLKAPTTKQQVIDAAK
jgi:hypothetical protein